MRNLMVRQLKEYGKKYMSNMNTMNNANIELKRTGSTEYGAFVWQERYNNMFYFYISMLGILDALNKVNNSFGGEIDNIKNVFENDNYYYFLPDSIRNAISSYDVVSNLNDILLDGDKHHFQLRLQERFVNAYILGIKAYNTYRNNTEQLKAIFITYYDMLDKIEKQKIDYENKMSKVKVLKRPTKIDNGIVEFEEH